MSGSSNIVVDPSRDTATDTETPSSTPPWPLHDAVRLGDQNKIREILAESQSTDHRFVPHDPDQLGFSPVHYIAISRTCVERVATLNLLLNYYAKDGTEMGEVDAVLNARDREDNTILHLAVKLKRHHLVNRLIGRTDLKLVTFKHDLRADAFAQNNIGWLPIHFAADVRLNVTLPTNIINYAPSLSGYQYDPGVQTPVQVAAIRGSESALEVFANHGFSFAPHDGKSLPEIVIAAGDSDDSVNCLRFVFTKCDDVNHELLLHQAAGQPRLFEAILDSKENILVEDVGCSKCTPLHHLARLVNTPNMTKCVQLLLDKKYHQNDLNNVLKFVNMKDKNEKAALDICCEEKNTAVAETILLATYALDPMSSSPATVSNYPWLQRRFLFKMYECIPLAMKCVLDKAVTVQQLQEVNKQRDYSVITGLGSTSVESAQLYNVVGHDWDVQDKILTHALTKNYLNDKWSLCEKRVYFSATLQFIVLLLFTASTAYCNCNQDVNAYENCCEGWIITSLLLLTLFVTTVLLVKEGYQFWSSSCRILYLKSWYNRAQISFGVVASGTLVLALCSGPWLWFFSILSLLLAWAVTILQLHNLPPIGSYISILAQVTEKSLLLLALFGLPTFIFFAQIFRILFPQVPAAKVDKENPPNQFQSLDQIGTIVKLLVMFIGELTFDETVGKLDPGAFRYFVALILFILFAIIATIVLFNLLLAIAVSITQEMKNKATTEVAKCQLEQIHFWETHQPWSLGAAWWRKTRSLTPPADYEMAPSGTTALLTASA